MTKQMMCVCGHLVASHMNELKCCLVCGCSNMIPDLQWNVTYEIGYDVDDYEDIAIDDSHERGTTQ